MIYAVGQGNPQELFLIEKEIRYMTAMNTNEQLKFVGLYTRKDFENFLKEEQLADIICADITIFQGIEQAEELRNRYPKAVLILIADTSISPMKYMKPTILASALLLKPLQKSVVDQVMGEIFDFFLQKETSEEMFLVENREEKHRIPYSQLLYFEARSKKIYACTRDCEYGFYDTMDHLEALYSENFIRCHRSFLVNRSHIDQVKLSMNCLLLSGGVEVPLSRSYKSQMKELY